MPRTKVKEKKKIRYAKIALGLYEEMILLKDRYQATKWTTGKLVNFLYGFAMEDYKKFDDFHNQEYDGLFTQSDEINMAKVDENLWKKLHMMKLNYTDTDSVSNIIDILYDYAISDYNELDRYYYKVFSKEV